MNAQIAKNAILFLERATMSGKEVNAYVEVLNYLSQIADPVGQDVLEAEAAEVEVEVEVEVEDAATEAG